MAERSLIALSVMEMVDCYQENGFFTVCNQIKSSQRLPGIFVWLADDLKENGFIHEKQSHELLASPLETQKLFSECIEAKLCNVR